MKIRSELKVLNLSAVASLDEGMEETLTLHRLGLFRELGESLKNKGVSTSPSVARSFKEIHGTKNIRESEKGSVRDSWEPLHNFN